MMPELEVTRALRRAAVRASRAPSVRNTEPWRFVLAPDSLEIHDDPYRRLRALDPRGRQLYVSCGCALLNARASLAFSGYDVLIDRFPDEARPHVVARIRIAGTDDPDTALAEVDPSADQRPANLQRPADGEIPAGLVDALLAAGTAEGVQVVRISSPEDLAAIRRGSALATNARQTDPASRAELQAWTTRWDQTTRTGEEAVQRPDWASLGRSHNVDEFLLVLGSDTDDKPGWLQAGEGLQRMVLTVSRWGFSAHPMTQVLEGSGSDQDLHDELSGSMFPQALLSVRLGPAMQMGRRRRLVDVLTEAK